MNISDHIPDYNELYDRYEANLPDPFISVEYPVCATCGLPIKDKLMYDWDGGTYDHIDCYKDVNGECVEHYIQPTADYIQYHENIYY